MTFSLLPVLFSALSLAGAPASTPVSCGATPYNEYGWAEWAPEPQVLLTPNVCLGLQYLQGDIGIRFLIQRHSNENMLYWAGVGALVTLHESTHIAGDHNETSTECRAMQLVPAFLGQYLTGQALTSALDWATRYDATLPAEHHEHAC